MNFYWTIIRQKERFLDYLYSKFHNPYNLNPSGNCPVQDWGQLKDGNYYYFRARGTSWRIQVGNIDSNDDKFFDNIIWKDGDPDYDVWPNCGWLTKRECIKLATKALNDYFAR